MSRLQIHHTAWPSGREPKDYNQVKEGGLWYADRNQELLNEGKRTANKPKDEVKEFCILFWQIAIAAVILAYVIGRVSS